MIFSLETAAKIGVTSAVGYCLPGGSVWALAIDSEGLPLPELLVPVYFAAQYRQ